jgi:hypothetical protein
VMSFVASMACEIPRVAFAYMIEYTALLLHLTSFHSTPLYTTNAQRSNMYH